MIRENILKIKASIPEYVSLVAVSKTKPIADIIEAYKCGQRIFGENKVQEIQAKCNELPKDIDWHLIGHLQSNKIKYIAPFVSLIHSVDSIKLLEMIDKEGQKNNRVIECLLQVYIAKEETKFGLEEPELLSIIKSDLIKEFKNVSIRGLMGIASFSNEKNLIRKEFKGLKRLFDKVKNDFFFNEPSFSILSMGMSGDYDIAIEEGSNMIRIGSNIFGERNYNVNNIS